MKFADILALCEKEGIELSVRDGALRVVSTRNRVSDEIKDILKANKLLLIAMLGGSGDASYQEEEIVADRRHLEAPQVTSFAQRRIWLESTLSEDKAIYNTRLAGTIRGPLDSDALERALCTLIDRHAVLRTVYLDDDGEPLQQVLARYEFRLSRHDCSDLDEAGRRTFMRELVDREMLHDFDLARDLPIRANLVRHAGDRHDLVLTIHHIATDGWSTGLLMRELDAVYDACLKGAENPLPDLPIQYVDYAVWQRARLSGPSLERLIDYWRERLDGIQTLHDLPLDFERRSVQSHQGRHFDQRIDRTLTAGLERLSSSLGVTMFVALQSMFALLISRYSGSRDVVMGSANANRIEGAVQPLLGCFLNNLVLRTDLSQQDLTVSEFMKRQQRAFIGDFEHQHVPFELLVEQINPERSLAFHPLVQIMFGYENNDYSAASARALPFDRHELEYEVSKFDLSLHALPVEGGIEISWGYSLDLFRAETIARMANSFETLLSAVVADPERPLHALPLVDEDERAALVALSEGPAPERASVLLPEMIRTWAAQRGDAPAVQLEDEVLSHAELEARSNRIARALVAAGVQVGDRVGVCQERTLEMVASVIGTMKAGAVYVPLDPGYPDERLAYLLSDAGIGHVLTEAYLAPQLPLSGQRVVLVSEAAAQDGGAYASPVDRGTVAYMIYTSGSTGQPKGVCVSHGALADKLPALAQHYGLSSADRGLLFASLSFDASLSQLLVPLSVGGSVSVRPDGVTEPSALLSYVASQGVTWMHVVPAYLRQLVEVEGWSRTSLRMVTSGGDVLDAGLREAWFTAERSGIALHNSYGPTEVTITSSVYRLRGDESVVGIGRPLANVRYWVLDERGGLLPRGAVGELCIGGSGVAEGYWGRESQTLERFVSLSVVPGREERVYRTGDRVRWGEAGQLEFVGRADHQVKVRGYRIELGEVESALRACAGVTGAVVKVEDDGLWAYVSLSGTDLGHVESTLSQRLPGYMLPSGYEKVEEWPLTRSGKIDRGALRRGHGGAPKRRGPANEVEEALLEIWVSLLKSDDIGVTDNFFQRGGHSLLATRLASQIRRRFEVDFTLKSLFELPSIEEQGRLIASQKSQPDEAASSSTRLPPIRPVGHDGPVALSYAQSRLWILSELENFSSAYNSSLAITIDGDLDAVALERTLSGLIDRHTVLRTVVRMHAGEPMQEVLPAPVFALDFNDVGALAPEAQDAAIAALARDSAARPFDLTRDLMLRGCLVRRAARRHVLVLTLHHIACDGWSMAVLIRELNALYPVCAAGAGDTRPALPVQYRDYAHWQRGWLQGEVLEAARGYWLSRLAGMPQVHQLPLDKPRPAHPSYRGAMYRQQLPATLKQSLESLSQRCQTTLFMTVQAAFALLLGRFSGERDIVMGTAIANREQSEVGELIGLFANTLVLRTQWSSEWSFVELLEASRRDLLADFAHQHMPFELLVESINPVRQLSYNPLFQIMLLWQNNEQAELALGEGLRFGEYALDRAVSKFDLTLTVNEDADGLSLYWRYATDLFTETSVRGWAESFGCLLDAAASAPQTQVGRLPVLGAAGRERLLAWHAPAPGMATVETAMPESLPRRIARQAALTPDAVALVSGERRWRYAELNARANRLAQRLRSEGVSRGDMVGVCSERHGDLVVALLGVLKAGAAYLPLDPGYPAERLRYMVADSGARWLVGDRDALSAWSGSGASCLALEDLGEDDIVTGDRADDAQPDDVQPDDLAYMIYTSGSTGRPKGVMIEHRALAHFLDGAHAALGTDIDAPYRWLAVTPVSFDISVLELFLPLCHGGTVVLADRETTQDGVALSSLLSAENINALQATPVTWKLLRETGWKGLAGLRVLVGGEYVPDSLGEWLAEAGQGAWNCYGPTEATVWTHMKRFARDGRLLAESASDLGGRLHHARQRVVDRDGELAPLGGVGELWLGGGQLARGYWQREALTGEKFVERDLLGGVARWYRTGDWVQQRHDGELRYLGRIDHQVKLRGHRIELGEIEQCLQALPEIADMVVEVYVPAEGGEAQLAAYAVLSPGHEAPEDAQWRAQLQSQLPAYMHPSSLTVLDAMPLTASGKIDRKALPAPHLSSVAEHVAPEGEVEETLVRIWSELLGVPSVGATANFFQLGGHSLLATRMINRLAEQGLRLELKQVFLHPTIRALGAALGSRTQAALPPPLVPEARASADDADTRSPASHAQTRLWFLEQLNPAPGAYHINCLLKVEASFDRQAFNEAMSRLVARHPALRTRFEFENDELYQVVRPLCVLDIPFFDLSRLPAAEAASELEALCDEQKYGQIDLGWDSPFNVRVIRTAAQRHFIFLTFHHIVCDGWSVDVFLGELERLYAAHRTRTRIELPGLPVTYQDYSRWQRDWLKGAELDALQGYWIERLRDAPAEHGVPLDRPRPSRPSFRGGIHRDRLDAHATARLKSLLAGRNTSLFVGLKALFCALLGRYSGEKDIVIGTAVANRQHKALEGVFGYFANTVTLRQTMSAQQTLFELVDSARDAFLSDYAHQHLPFEMLVDAVNPERRPAMNPLFQIMFVLQNVEAPAEQTAAGVETCVFEPQDQDRGNSQFDITLAVREDGDGLVFAWRYATDLFDADTIGRLASSFVRLVEGAVDAPGANVHALPILDDAEIAREVLSFNETQHAFAEADWLVHELVEHWSARTPDNVAVVYGGQTQSYRELNAHANALAGTLIDAGVRPGALIGVFMGPSIEMVVALLAALKAGAAYVPLDPSYPEARIRHMLKDSGASLVVARSATASLAEALIAGTGIALLQVDAASPPDPSADNLPRSRTGIAPDALAYAIYTSGSTGLPKGVALHHRGLVNHVLSQGRLFGVTQVSRMMQYAALSFDVATCEIFVALCNGAQLHVVDEAMKKQPDALSRLIEQERLTHVMLIPSVLALLAPERMASVESIIVGGETISTEQADFWSERHRVFNAYGPSEATICALAEEYAGKGVAIGHPIDNMTAYVLDAHRMLVPRQTPGELYLGGVGLARGYLGPPELTASRFILHRFENGLEMRLYRTGDLVRRLADGRIEFLGRVDNQVKIRGYRIETEEVATSIGRVAGVQAAVVHAQSLSSGEKVLIAYVVPQSPVVEERWRDFVSTIRQQLARDLPAYMLPADYLQLAALPRLENGKVDRSALPKPAMSAIATAGATEKPVTNTEIALCGLLSEVLGCGEVGLSDNFFRLGGNSILAMKLNVRANAAFGVSLPLSALFDAEDVRTLSAWIDDMRLSDVGAGRPPIEPLDASVLRSPLSYEQQRIWFLSEVDGNKAAYNASWSLSIDGDLDVDALERTLSGLITRHTVLRTVVRMHAGEPMQEVLPAPVFALDFNDVGALAPEAQDAAIAALARDSAARPFDLTRDLMLRGCLVRRAARRHVLVLTLHHIACDGWSMAVLIRELNALYPVCAAGAGDTRPALPVQYRDYAHWQRGWLQGEVLEAARGYWLSRLGGMPQVHQLPLDKPRPAHPSYHGAMYRQQLPATLKQSLESLSQRCQTTLFMTVQAAFALLLGRFSGERDIVMGTAIANREQSEVGELIGLFANTLVLRTQWSSEWSFVELLEASRRDLLADFAHQHMPFELLVESINPVRQLSYNPLFQIMLLWQNNEQAELALGEGLRFGEYALDRAVSKFDLTLTVNEDEDGLSLYWRYATDLFTETSVRGWAESFGCLLDAAASEPQTQVGRLPVLGAAERERLLAWHAPAPGMATVETAMPESLPRRIERQAALTPDAVALVSGERRWRYAELNARANRLAQRLRSEGVSRGEMVGVCSERHGDLVVALLGVLKAGAAYLPLDPGYPAERLRYMVADSGARWLVGDRDALSAWSGSGASCLALEDLGEDDVGPGDRADDAPPDDVQPDDLAYMIYTSGSTGRPKGVMIEHRALAHFLDGTHLALEMQDGDEYRCLAVAPVSFDISVLELFLPLCHGGTVVLADRETIRDGVALSALVSRHRINLLQATPVTWKLLRETGWTGQAGLRVIVGGEYVPDALGQWLASVGRIAWNGYGPTEATVYTHLKPFARDGRVLCESVSDLGGRLQHVQHRVVDRDGELAPIGGVGELWIGGAALARGYWQREALTGEKFVERDLLGGVARWYRTGDWVQQRHDGELRYLGRIDHQVKLRGHRIELGEIEQCLQALPEIADVVVEVYVPAEGGEAQLAAYAVLSPGHAAPEDAQWRAQLQSQLPAYMHPSSLTVLDAMPLTASGKIDRKALPAPHLSSVAEHVAPEGEVEETLARIWSELLGVPSVGATANFFQLGGHSLLATRMVSMVGTRLGARLPIKVVFDYPTIRDLGSWIEVGRTTNAHEVAARTLVADEALI